MRKLLRYVGLWPLIFLFATACGETGIEGVFYGSGQDYGAVLINLPAKENNLTYFSPSVSGDNGIVGYKYSYSESDLIDCADPLIYSSTVIPISTPMDIYVYNSVLHTLCVVGVDADGNWQSYDKATHFKWLYQGPN
jgi:hypothetical protein